MYERNEWEFKGEKTSVLNEKYTIVEYQHFGGYPIYKVRNIITGKTVEIMFDRISEVEKWAEKHLLKRMH